jgi:hypothetical protein
MTITPERAVDVGSAGFFRRNRVRRLVVGAVMTVVLVAAYIFGIQSYATGIGQTLPAQSPPAAGASVVIVPERVSPEDQELPAQVLVFPSADLVDSAGLLTQSLEVRIEPAIEGQLLTFPAGEPAAPQRVVLPAAGVVQQYPFDSYAIAADVHAHSLYADSSTTLPIEASVFFRVPGWTDRDAASTLSAGEGVTASATLVRDGSTRSIALLLLLLMLVLAIIAIAVTGSATRGRMRLELSVASWMTALLFALIPLRGFFPGSPPLGSWIDVLVFFWVELILMLSVAAVVTTILMRAKDARLHPEESA